LHSALPHAYQNMKRYYAAHAAVKATSGLTSPVRGPSPHSPIDRAGRAREAAPHAITAVARRRLPTHLAGPV